MQTTTEEDKSLWRRLALTSLYSSALSKKAAPKSAARRAPARLAALNYAKAVEHFLEQMTAQKLADFIADPNDFPYEAVLRPRLVTVTDQGSDGWSLQFWLAYKCRLRLVFKFDVFHR